MVGGTGRSGTTVFARLLGTHSNIFSLRWESQFIVARHGLLELIDAGFAKQELERFLELLRGRWFKRTLNPGQINEYEAGLCADVSLDRLEGEIGRLEERLRRSGASAGYAAAASFVEGILGEPMAAAGAVRWCEKTPRNALYANRLAEMFPDMRFINVVRDGRDVACSMVERRFWPIGATQDFPTTSRFCGEVTFEKAIEYWVEMVNLSREVASGLPEKAHMDVRLEDLVRDRELTVRRVLKFLGEPFDRALIEFPMREGSLGRWRRDLDPKQVLFAEEAAGEELVRQGYAVDGERAT